MSRDRQTPSLAPPPDDPVALRLFPHRPIDPAMTLFRVVRKGRGPWWFGSSMAGRFDLPAPHGTCYLATDPLAALLEVLGADHERWIVSQEFLAERRLRQLSLPREITVADLTARGASGFGLTAEIGTLVPYDLPQAWAAKLHAVRFGGLVYWLRHDPSRAEGWALFGPQGERKSYRRGRELPISSPLIGRLWRECRIAVARTPRSADLTILGDA
ncbi:MAG: RES family NAD+ phosphorylase [Thermoanaerobaculia bacterium]